MLAMYVRSTNILSREFMTYAKIALFLQHVALRLGTLPYLDQHLWEIILRRTDWITCLILNHIQIAKELVPCYKKAQDYLDRAVASGNIQLVSRILQTCSAVPNLDLAAKADQFEMLKFLDSMDRTGTCICLATGKMAIYAALSSNLSMLGWLIKKRLEVDGDGVLAAAAGLGNIQFINWILKQDKLFNIANLSSQARDALSRALQAGHLDIAIFLIEHFSLQKEACVYAASDGCLTALKQIWLMYSGRMDEKSWSASITQGLKRGDTAVFQFVLDGVHNVSGTLCSESPLLEYAAKYGSVSVMADLASAMPMELKKLSVTKAAMRAAISRGDSEMVMNFLPSDFKIAFTVIGFGVKPWWLEWLSFTWYFVLHARCSRSWNSRGYKDPVIRTV